MSLVLFKRELAENKRHAPNMGGSISSAGARDWNKNRNKNWPLLLCFLMQTEYDKLPHSPMTTPSQA